MTKEEYLELGIKYIENYNKYPVSKHWTIATAGCSRDRIYEQWGSWPSFIESLRLLKDIGEYNGSAWNKGLTTSTEKLKKKFCKTCKNTFTSYNREQKYCSKSCMYKNPVLGGIRKGAGRAKVGYCEGIYCGSTYELAWVIYNLDNKISFTRCSDYFIYNVNKKYYPDFIQNGTYIEIKGYHTETVDIKAKAVKDSGYSIKILYKEDLEYAFSWIKDNYDCPIEQLFDEYAPAYTYKCCYCGCSFKTDKKRKTTKIYCSNVCSGKGLRYGAMV